MIASKAKTNDREVRTSLLRAMKVCLEEYKKNNDSYWLKEATYYGEESKRYKERMQNFDYSEENEMIKRVEALQKKFNEIYKNL